MILLFFQYLAETFSLKIPVAFTATTTRMLLVSCMSLLTSIVLGSRMIGLLMRLKIGHNIRVTSCATLGKSYDKSEDIPSMGGVIFLLSMLSQSLLWLNLKHPYSILLIVTLVYFALLGFLDDYLKMKREKGLSAKKKFTLQALFAIYLAAYMWSTQGSYEAYFFIPMIKKPFIILGTLGLIALLVTTFFVIVGTSNAVNLSDGLDGLAMGLSLPVAFVLAIFAFASNHVNLSEYLNILYIEGSGEIAIMLSSLIGSGLGFLWYNSFPAEVFMGDTGSLALGGLLGVCAVLLRREFLFAFICGVFVVEALSVIIQVLSYHYRNKKRVFLCAPLHHHYQMKNIPESKIVFRFWMVGLVLALIGLLTLKFQ